MDSIYNFIGVAVVWACVASFSYVVLYLFAYFVLRHIYCGVWYASKIVKYDLVNNDSKTKYWKVRLYFRAVFKTWPFYFDGRFTLSANNKTMLRAFDFHGWLPKQIQ